MSLCFNQCNAHWRQLHPGIPFPYTSHEHHTALPTTVALTRAVAIAAFTALASLIVSTAFYWSVVIAGAAYASWIIYSNLCLEDPLMKQMHHICGGQANFEKLPEIHLEKTADLSEAIKKLDWDRLEHKMAKTKTANGRHVVIIKAQNKVAGTIPPREVKSILAFVERCNDGFYYLSDGVERKIYTSISGSMVAEFQAQMRPSTS